MVNLQFKVLLNNNADTGKVINGPEMSKVIQGEVTLRE